MEDIVNKLLYVCTSCLLIGCSCSKPESDLAEITSQVLKEDQSLTIEITPGSKIK